jgi:DNA-binding NarL/FixJ family response regulator
VTLGASPDRNAPAGVLICDDNAAMRTLLGVIVGSSPGLRVLGEANDGNEAVAEARRHQPDVILLDLAMPNRNGLEALPELRSVAPEARIIVFSGFATATVADQVLALGAASYLEKGADPDMIIDAIEHALAGARGSSAALTVPG